MCPVTHACPELNTSSERLEAAPEVCKHETATGAAERDASCTAAVPIFEDPPKQNCLALLAAVSILWCTEALPLYVTSMLVPLLAVVLRVMMDDSGKTPQRKSAPDAADAILKSMFSQVGASPSHATRCLYYGLPEVGANHPADPCVQHAARSGFTCGAIHTLAQAGGCAGEFPFCEGLITRKQACWPQTCRSLPSRTSLAGALQWGSAVVSILQC